MKDRLPMLSANVETVGVNFLNGAIEILSKLTPGILVLGVLWLAWRGRSKSPNQ